jgi:hypothetical protein
LVFNGVHLISYFCNFGLSRYVLNDSLKRIDQYVSSMRRAVQSAARVTIVVLKCVMLRCNRRKYFNTLKPSGLTAKSTISCEADAAIDFLVRPLLQLYLINGRAVPNGVLLEKLVVRSDGQEIPRLFRSSLRPSVKFRNMLVFYDEKL